MFAFSWDCWRMGDVTGLFVADIRDVEDAFGEEIYFGEILGKHSEIRGEFTENDVEMLLLPEETLDLLIEKVGKGDTTLCGYNPLEYIEDEEDVE